MNFRVNLLQQEDVQTGPTGRRSLGTVMGVLAGVIVLYLLGSNIIKGLATRADLHEARKRWAEVESQVEVVKTARGEVRELTAMQSELQGWQKARVEVAPILQLMYETVPATIQLTRMNMRSSYASEKAAKKPPNGEKAPPPKMYRTYRITLDGIAVGDQSDQVVVDFVSQLKALAMDSEVFPSVKLLRMQSGSNSEEDGSSVRTFNIEILSTQRMLQS